MPVGQGIQPDKLKAEMTGMETIVEKLLVFLEALFPTFHVNRLLGLAPYLNIFFFSLKTKT